MKEKTNLQNNQTRTDITEVITREVNNIQQEVQNVQDETKDNMESMEKQVQENKNEIRELVGKEVVMITPNVHYCGENKNLFAGNVKYHPVPFIKFLKNKEGQFVNFTDFKDFIKEHLGDEALLWFLN